jgi:predicted alpha/beta-fold hydrolase
MLAWNAGCNVIRMNMRNCGGTESWTPTLYHSGLSADVGAVLQHFVAAEGLRRVAMVGYSMGGNLVLKLAGELGASAPEWLLAAVGVSPASDLAASADALHEPANRIYERHFLRNLIRRFRGKAKLFPEIYAVPGSRQIGPVQTIREFDEQITARFCGFTGADDYYFRSSAARVVDRIAVPTLVLHAFDDPFIRMLPETRATLAANPAVTLIETEHGGHCAFLSARAAHNANSPVPMGRHWAETTLVRFLMAEAGHGHGS